MRVGRVVEVCLLCLEALVLRQALAGDVHLERRREGPVGANGAYEVGRYPSGLDNFEKVEFAGVVARDDLCGDGAPVRGRAPGCAAAACSTPTTSASVRMTTPFSRPAAAIASEI